MKRILILITLLLPISVVSGYLMSKVSWIGRIGMSLFYKEYNFLKVWWQGAAFVFMVYLVLMTLHYIVYRKTHVILGRLIHFLGICAAMGGVYLSYDDFQNDFSHHLLRSRFHTGVYVFWGGWVLIALFFLLSKKMKKQATKSQDKSPVAVS